MSVWIVLGLILLIVGAILFFVQRNQKSRLFSIKSARKVQAAELHTTAQAIADEIGGGNWRDYVKVWGEVKVKDPLISELKQTPCVHYAMTVKRVYEKTVTEKDSDGRTTTKTERASDTLSSNKQSVPFYVKDSSGEVLVEPDGAAMETVKVLDEFRPVEDARGGMLQFGNFSFSLGDNSFGTGGGSRTLGYQYTESILPLGRNILVVGSASDDTGIMTLCKPTSGDKKYIISLKSDEALAASTEKGAQGATLGMAICLGLGIVLLIVGIVS
ncbi:MAG: E3 ubiquitin ligase family protein [Cyanobacteria bacterium P01_D01_bin.115]